MNTPMSGTGRRWAWATVCLVLVAVPFFSVDFIPSTDLPQHLGQLRLFARAWADPTGPLEIHWWTPYGLVYALLAIPWMFLAPVAAGRIGVLLVVWLQVGAVHLVAAKWRRPLAGAVLASAFIFNNQFYWGFLNYLFGSVAFFAWFAITRRSPADDENRWQTAMLFLVGASVLYLSHALWFACGVLWFAIEALISRRKIRDLAWRAAGLAPVMLGAAWWYRYLLSSNFGGETVWSHNPLVRLKFNYVVLAGLGGIRNSIEIIIVVAVLLWALGSVIARRKERLFGCDAHFLALTALFLALYMFLPDKHSNTIRFSTRWLPFAFMSLMLAVGQPPLRRWMRRAVPVVLLGTLMVVTTAYWRRFERVELAGLQQSLTALPREPRVIGLSYVNETPLIIGQPFIQTFAWAQAVHGGELSFSFGYFAPSLVVYKDDTRVQWSWGLEWFPKAVRRSDFQYFDFALVGGDEEAHERMRRVPELVPVVDEGVWRLYRVEQR